MIAESNRPAHECKAACCPGWHGAAVILFVPLLIVIALLVRAEWKEQTTGSFVFIDPPDCITALILAQQAGDRDAQLGCFADTLLTRRQINPSTRTADAGDLAGFAITNIDYPGPNEATLVLERIYREGNQRDRVRLQQSDDGWKIVELTALGHFAQPIPYGTPVTASVD